MKFCANYGNTARLRIVLTIEHQIVSSILDLQIRKIILYFESSVNSVVDLPLLKSTLSEDRLPREDDVFGDATDAYIVKEEADGAGQVNTNVSSTKESGYILEENRKAQQRLLCQG